MSNRYTLAEIGAHLGADVVGDANIAITGLGSLASARSGDISHLSNPAYKAQLADTQASAVILKEADLEGCPSAALVIDNPYLAFARVSQLFSKRAEAVPGIHASAVIDSSAEVDPTASIGPNVVIGAATVIGPRVRIGANSVVGARCRLDEDCTLMANATLYDDVRLGARCVIHSAAVIGAEGFGFTPDEQGRWQAIAQIGGVQIGCDVSVGASSCIDCGAIDDTVIEDGVQIDNHVQIGHNCHIGAHTLLCGMVGLVGSTRIGRHCVFAGRSGAGGDHPIEVCDQVMVTAGTILTQTVTTPGVYSGTVLFHEHSKWRRNALRFASLDDMFKRLKRLEKWRSSEDSKPSSNQQSNQASKQD